MSSLELTRRRSTSRLATSWARSVLIHAILIVGALTMLAPFVWMIHTSLMPEYEAYKFPPKLIPSHWAWENYPLSMSFFPFGRFYLNSAVVSCTITVVQLLTCSLGAYAFARLRFPGRNALFLLYLATMMVPFQVTLVPLFIIVRGLGWINTYLALTVPFFFSAFGTFLLRQYFLTIPRDLDDAARIDGAGYFSIYWRVIMPLAGPALATLGIFVFLYFWNLLLWPLVVINSTEMRTIPFGLAMFVGTATGEQIVNWNLLMAASTVAVIPVLIVFIAGQKYFVRGITLTGIKG